MYLIIYIYLKVSTNSLQRLKRSCAYEETGLTKLTFRQVKNIIPLQLHCVGHNILKINWFIKIYIPILHSCIIGFLNFGIQTTKKHLHKCILHSHVIISSFRKYVAFNISTYNNFRNTWELLTYRTWLICDIVFCNHSHNDYAQICS